MQKKDNVHDCAEQDLGAMLARLFSEGHDEVEIMHPVDGPVVVTKADYKKHLHNIDRYNKMSPGKRVTHHKRVKNIKNQKQIRFRTAMINAPVYEVDINDDANFGKDIDGNDIDMQGMVFTPVAQYLKGIEPIENEIGCFVDEYDEKRKPIRITTRVSMSPASGGS